MTDPIYVDSDFFSEERRADSERWERIFMRGVAAAKAENERLGIVEDYSKYDDESEASPLSKVAEDSEESD